MAEDSEKPGFEAALKQLEAIVDRLEAGSLSLEESLAAFEQGIGLVRRLAATLDNVERKVEVLLRENGGTGLRLREVEPAEDDEDDEDAEDGEDDA
jgi:exodeoxyribonuclease VII small subunit